VGGAVTPPTAFQSVSEQPHEPGRTAQLEPFLPQCVYRLCAALRCACCQTRAARAGRLVGPEAKASVAISETGLDQLVEAAHTRCAFDPAQGSGEQDFSRQASRVWRHGRRSGRLDGFGEGRLRPRLSLRIALTEAELAEILHDEPHWRDVLVSFRSSSTDATRSAN
jgi:hypothetical protein